MQMKKINYNMLVKVKLTPYAKQIYKARYGHEPDVDHNEFTQIQLWRFMMIYGEHIPKGSAANDSFILEDGCIYMDEEDLDEV